MDLAPRSGVERWPDIRGQLELIEQNIEEEKPDLVVLLGDVADPDSGARTLRALVHVAGFAKRVSARCLLDVLPGNHDVIDSRDFSMCRSTVSILSVVDPAIRVREIVEVEYIGDDLALLFLPYLSGAHAPTSASDPGPGRMTATEWLGQETSAALARIPSDKRIIAFCHLDIAGAVVGGEERMLRGGKLLLPSSVEADPRVELIVGGHIHRAQRVREKIVIAGSLERIDFNEATDEKGYVVIDTGEKIVKTRRSRRVEPAVAEGPK